MEIYRLEKRLWKAKAERDNSVVLRVGNRLLRVRGDIYARGSGLVSENMRLRRARGDVYRGRGKRIGTPGNYTYSYDETTGRGRGRAVKNGERKLTEWHSSMLPDEAAYSDIQSGNQEALARYFFDAFWSKGRVEPKFTRGRDPYKTEDALQETYISVAESQAAGKLNTVDRFRFPRYVAEIFERRMIDAYRSDTAAVNREIIVGMRNWKDAVDNDVRSAENEFFKKEYRVKVERDLKELSERVKVGESLGSQVVWDRYIRGEKLEEIAGSAKEAGIGNLSLDAVKSRVRRIARKLVDGMIKYGYLKPGASIDQRKAALKDFRRDFMRLTGGPVMAKARGLIRWIRDLNGRLFFKTGTFSGYPLQGRMRFGGLDISIENRKGSVRRGTDRHGNEWETKMLYPYGYIRMSEGSDGDHVDCFVGPDEKAKNVYVVHQNDPETGEYDEDKVMLGFNSKEEAEKAYRAHYDQPDKFFGDMSELAFDNFREKVLATRSRRTKMIKGIGILEEVDGKLVVKAKRAQIGEERMHGGQKMRKIAEGRWAPVKGDGKGDKKQSVGSKKTGIGEKAREALKDSLKRIIGILTAAIRGKPEETVEHAGQVGAEMEAKGKQRQEERKREMANKSENK